MADEQNLDIEGDDDLLQIDIEDSTPETTTETPEVKPEAKAEVTTEDAVAEIKRQLEEERRGREEAARRAAQAEQQIQTAQSQVYDSYRAQLQASMNAHNTALSTSKAKLAEALRNGDYDDVAEQQAYIARLQVNIQKIEAGQRQLDMEAQQAQYRQQQAPQVQADPEEALLSQVSPRSAQWLRANPAYMRDPAKKAELMRAHHAALGEGIEPDTDAYFAALETRVGLRKAEATAKSVQNRPKPVPAAPVSQQAFVPGGGQRVSLTAEEVSFCKENDIDMKDYARNKLKMQKERA